MLQKKHVHDSRLSCLTIGWAWKLVFLDTMKLKTLVLGFHNLFCPSGCCRVEALVDFSDEMGQRGPWYQLPSNSWSDEDSQSITGLTERCETHVRVKGLRDKREEELLSEVWGLEIRQAGNGLSGVVYSGVVVWR